MKELRLKIQIHKPVAEVFWYVVNPANTPKWIDAIVHEQTNEWPVRVGTMYQNQDREGEWTMYMVTQLAENSFFEWVKEDENYHVRYTLRPVGGTTTELDYYEWVEVGELMEPFTMETLEKLKSVMEGDS